jgi:hypothetical protein
MATYRGTSDNYAVGSTPPEITWTVVTGDTAAFKAYVTDENLNPLVISEWTIEMDIARKNASGGYDIILELYPEATATDGPGQFTVSLTEAQSRILRTNDAFDIQMTKPSVVWTIAKGKMVMVQDVTNATDPS